MLIKIFYSVGCLIEHFLSYYKQKYFYANEYWNGVIWSDLKVTEKITKVGYLGIIYTLLIFIKKLNIKKLRELFGKAKVIIGINKALFY